MQIEMEIKAIDEVLEIFDGVQASTSTAASKGAPIE
eukprot:SAG11_NODE_138_length_15111_cov_11.388289_14_plen_36_part_00